MKNKVKIIIVDDHAMFRDGLKSVLSQIDNYIVINEASNGIEFLELLNHHVPDLVLMDISMPVLDGIKATEKALKKYPNLKVIALSSFSDHIYYYKMIKAGVQGFVQKISGQDELQQAIDAIINGGNYFPQDVLKKLIFKIGQDGTEAIGENKLNLSRREIEVLELICKGYTNNEIAESLHLSSKTINNHRANLLSKTATKNTAHLVMFAIKNHLIEI